VVAPLNQAGECWVSGLNLGRRRHAAAAGFILNWAFLLMTHQPIQLTSTQIVQFRDQGFLILEKFLDQEIVDRIADRLDPLFATQFETGVYPDEWHGRPGLSQPNATRQMSGLWRCDRTVASLTLSAEIARLSAMLAGWSGARLATDSCWIKPPGAPEVLFHRNNTAVACFNPATVITGWIALTPTAANPLEIVPGSHRWPHTDRYQFLHAPTIDYRQPLWDAAIAAQVTQPDILPVELPSGGCIFLHGDLWHGSGRNPTTDQTRRSFAVSTLPVDVTFQAHPTGHGYIFSRYQTLASDEVDESFFPILWTADDYQTPMVAKYCQDALTLA
jgi:phytanoyl-CoA hydroxylase